MHDENTRAWLTHPSFRRFVLLTIAASLTCTWPLVSTNQLSKEECASMNSFGLISDILSLARRRNANIEPTSFAGIRLLTSPSSFHPDFFLSSTLFFLSSFSHCCVPASLSQLRLLHFAHFC